MGHLYLTVQSVCVRGRGYILVRQAGGPPVLDRSVTLLLLVDEEGDVPVTVDLVNFFLQLAGERVWVGALLEDGWVVRGWVGHQRVCCEMLCGL